jgi:hypothetical protein
VRISPVVAAWLALGASTAMATDWLPPGDTRLRSDLKLLADAAEIDIPLEAWPLPVPDVRRALALREPSENDYKGPIAAALARVTQAVEQAQEHGAIDVRVTAGRAPLLKTFDHTPREKAEAQAAWSWQSGGFSGVVSAVVVADPLDDQTARPDGTYVAYDFDRWQVRAGWVDRYWGSSSDGSLILGTNARPTPALSIERTVSNAPEARWLRWFGPWRGGMFIGTLENHRDDFDEPVFFGMHVEVKPRENIDLGLFRTAQLCGQGRECSAASFWKMFIGHDNVGINVSAADQPGNQMGGADLRWAHPIGHWPYAIFAQIIGEDGKSGIPVKALRNVGVETTFGNGGGYLRARLEYTDTKCTSSTIPKQYNCAYRNSVFNYRYRGRIIGHSLDNDAAIWTLGVDRVDDSGTVASTAIRFGDINRDGPPDPTHAISPTPLKLWEVEGRLRKEYSFGTMEAAVLVDHSKDQLTDRSETAIRGFITWSKSFGGGS